MKFYLPILLYHHVVPDASGSDLQPFIVNEKDFIWQLDLLEQSGYEAITLQQLTTVQDFSKKVIITFDDCPVNLIDHALPHLARKKWPAVFFAVAGQLGGMNEWNVRKGKTRVSLMNEQELQLLVQQGHEVGAHSITHPHLHTLSKEEATREIVESKRILEQVINREISSFAYPYGHYIKDYSTVMRDAGYKIAVSMYSKAITPLSDLYCIRRTVVETKETPKSLLHKLSRKYNLGRIYTDRLTLKKEGLK